jgi:peptidyl-prolyl cis-trans isomerase SurA
MKTVKLSLYRRGLITFVFAFGLVLPTMTQAQIVVIANGSPITEFDIQQRTRLLASSSQKAPSRKDVINELIDDRIKITRAKDYGLTVSDAEVDAGFQTMAARQHITPEQFTQVLERSSITPGAIKDRIRAEMTWSQLVRGKFSSSIFVGEGEAANAMKKADGAVTSVAYLYTLYPITIVVPKGAAEGTLALKRAEAENLRNRFQDCKQGLALARRLRDVAVREPVNRSSTDLPEQLQEMLGKMVVGRLTPPEVTAQGLQMFAVCEKAQTKADSPKLREMRDKIYTQRYETESKKFLEELRKQAMIVYK